MLACVSIVASDKREEKPVHREERSAPKGDAEKKGIAIRREITRADRYNERSRMFRDYFKFMFPEIAKLKSLI